MGLIGNAKQGSLGPTGAQGPIGLMGAPGIMGDDGDEGERGPPGPAGAQGATGSTGAAGTAAGVVANPSGTQSLNGAAGTHIINFATEITDTSNTFDNSAMTWTPAAGSGVITAYIKISFSTGTNNIDIAILEGSTEIARGTVSGTSVINSITLNGTFTTDGTKVYTVVMTPTAGGSLSGGGSIQTTSRFSGMKV